MRRPAARIALWAAFSFMLGFSYKYHLPKFERLLLIEVEKLSERHSPVRVWAQRLHLTLVPLAITLEDVRLLPQAKWRNILAPTSLREAGARLALWPLLRGELRLAQIFVRDSALNIFLRPELFIGSTKGQTARIDFESIYRLPIDELVLDNVRIQGRALPQNVVFRVGEINCTIENRYRSLFVDLIAPEVLVKPSGPNQPLSGSFELRTLIEARQAQISALKIRADESFLIASGHLKGDFAAGQADAGALEARAKLRLPDLNTWEHAFFSHSRLPTMEGRAEFDLNAEVQGPNQIKIESDVHARGLKIDKFTVGEIKTHLTSDLKRLSTPSLRIQDGPGLIEFKEVEFTLKPKPFLKTSVHVDHELNSFLSRLSLPRIPIFLPVHGDATCEGHWADKPRAACHTKITSPRLWIFNLDEAQPPAVPSTIVDLHDLRVEGDAQISSTEMTFKSELGIGKSSRGSAEGKVAYEEGFKISYRGDVVDFADVTNLANLKMEGRAKLEGTTEGNASKATIDLNADAHDFWLEDYPFGDFTARTSYADGQLKFNRAQGKLRSSRYTGQVALDLRKKLIKLSLQLPALDLGDVQKLFRRQIDIPLNFAGAGQAQIEAQGPFRLGSLTYRVHSSFYHGELAGEGFDEFNFNVSAKDGYATSDKIMATKSSGQLNAKGTVSPTGWMEGRVEAHGLRLEQSENINKFGLEMQGLADFDVGVSGQLPRPQVLIDGSLTHVILSDAPAADSNFRIRVERDRVEAIGHFLGDTLDANLTWPLNTDGAFALGIHANKWDFTNIFRLVSKSAREMDFSTQVSGRVNLGAPHGGFWKSNGQATFTEFTLRKGPSSLSAHKPMVLNFSEGEVNSSDFALSSGANYLKLDAVSCTREHLNASLNGKLDLALLGIFTPFLSDLRGNLALSVDATGSLDQPRFNGSALIDKGFIKLNDFTHPFANARADLELAGQKVSINSFAADLAGGKISGEGKIQIAGPKRPVSVHAEFADVRLNFPENLRTQGAGTVAITGQGVPYNLAIDYGVTGGEIVYELGEGTQSAASVRPSAFLPQFLAQETFHPFYFDIHVDLKRPVAVNTSLIQAQVGGQLGVSGTGDRIVLDGTITPLPGAKVFFKDRPFEVTSAFVEYKKNLPAEPRIFLTANSHVVEFAQNDAGKLASTVERTYDINLLVQGRGPSPQIVLTSQPPLPQNDIVSLLALGVTTGGGYGLDPKGTTLSSGTSDSQTTANSSAAIGATLLQKAGGKKLKESLGVDVKVSTTQSTPDLASFPKVTLSKQWTPKFGASASSTLQANPSNDVKLEYKVNKNVSVVGSWNGREHDYLQEQNDTSVQSVFGLDLEYRMQFK